jgi:hypothetical protein
LSLAISLFNQKSGWDVGIDGMRVGGERLLTIPAPMGYGKKGTDGIPGNSTLIFGPSFVFIRCYFYLMMSSAECKLTGFK